MSTTQVFCPSCGTQQPLSEKCIQCGYGFPQQRVNPSELEPTRPIQTVPPKPKVPLPNPSAPEPPRSPAETARAEVPEEAAPPEGGAPVQGQAPPPAHPHPHPHAHPHPPAHPPAGKKKALDPKRRIGMIAGLVVVFGVALALIFGRSGKPEATGEAVDPNQQAEAQARIEQLRTERDRTSARTGTWTGRGEGHGRVAEATISADEDGKIREASVTIREGAEGILAGFQVEPKAEAMLKELLVGYDPVKRTLEANPSFLRWESWAAPGVRTWKAIEGIERIPRKPSANTPDLSMFVDYLVLESTEPDAIIQVGVSRKGLVMFLNGSKKFSTEMERGKDLVTKVVRPGQEQEIERFADIVFNFSGQLNFVSGRVDGAVASPLASAEGIALSLAKQP